jgi:hypothetical protein
MSKSESAQLILRLYELRRERKMRKARQWFAAWQPAGVEDYLEALRGENGAYLRMVTSYWDMAATLLLHGAIDAPMFHETTSEHILVYAKLQPFLAELRATVRQPGYLERLERAIMASPDSAERIAYFQERFRAAREAALEARAPAPAADRR